VDKAHRGTEQVRLQTTPGPPTQGSQEVGGGQLQNNLGAQPLAKWWAAAW